MTDVTTQKSLKVLTGGGAGPYIRLPVTQLDEVTRLFDNNHIGYWVNENFISICGRPEMAIINLDRRADVTAVQALLDNVP